MKQKQWLFAIIALLVLLLLASIPRLSDVQSVEVDRIFDYPVLFDAYEDLCEAYSLHDITTDPSIHIVTVKNLWGSWQRYILPCYSTYVPTVPTAGSTDVHAGLHILAPWSEENLFTDIIRLKVRDFSLSLEPAENLFVYELAEVTHASMYPVHCMVYSRMISFDDAVICNRQPTVFADYSVATNNSAKERNEIAITKFTWDYSLRFMGRQIWQGIFAQEIDHIVNA